MVDVAVYIKLTSKKFETRIYQRIFLLKRHWIFKCDITIEILELLRTIIEKD